MKAIVSFMLSLLVLAHANAADGHAGSPLSLIVTYHTSAANRAALRAELEGAGVRQFEHWKKDGVLADYRLLFNRYADSDNMDAVALLSFANGAATERWKAIERSAPGGLTRAALALVTAVHTAPADLERSKRAAPTTAQSVFMVIPYEVLISAGDYVKYADGYAIPQFDGWIEEGILANYALYVDRYGAGRPWSTMLLLEYKSEAALGAREAVVAKVRARLKDVPAWKAISDNKKTIRNEKQLVVADAIVAD
jgi:hypothetical protein